MTALDELDELLIANGLVRSYLDDRPDNRDSLVNDGATTIHDWRRIACWLAREVAEGLERFAGHDKARVIAAGSVGRILERHLAGEAP
jgi:hypothetical protein